MICSRQPVHVVYGGAHLFRRDIARRLGDLARRAMNEYAADPAALAGAVGIAPELADCVHARVVEKLRREPVEDYRLDFEDGFGCRPDSEEDTTAEAAAREMAAARDERTLPAFIGIRIKPLDKEWRSRSLRTLEIFLKSLGSPLPENFTVTLPKVTAPEEVARLAALDLPRIEIMIETPPALFILPELIGAAGGRCVGAHFGAYDYTASLGIAASHQHMLHPACDFARSMMQARLARTGVAVSDGATNLLPMPIHRGPEMTAAQKDENRAAMYRAWKLHFSHTRRSLENGFYQGWDLHPAQLVSRYAAVYSFFLEGLDAASERLRHFIAQAAQATQVRGVFDDAATGQGLLNYFTRALNCGAITESEARERTGLSAEELRGASFAKILNTRRETQ
jgi:hypothetical protein